MGRYVTSVYIDEELGRLAKAQGVNFSNVLDRTLRAMVQPKRKDEKFQEKLDKLNRMDKDLQRLSSEYTSLRANVQAEQEVMEKDRKKRMKKAMNKIEAIKNAGVVARKGQPEAFGTKRER